MENALINACKNNQLAVIRVLMKKNLNLNYSDDSGKTPLLYCVENGNLDAASELIKAGADYTHTDNASLSCLHYAVKSGNREMLKMLLALEDMDIDHKDRLGETALFTAAKSGKRDMAELLLRFGAQDLPNNQSVTALDAASAGGFTNIVELLLGGVPKSGVKAKSDAPAYQLFKCSQCGSTNLDLSVPGYAVCQHCEATFVITNGKIK